MFIKSKPELKLGHVASKTMSLGQFLEKPFVHCGGQSFDPIFMKIVRIFILIKSRPELKIGYVGS